MISQLFLVLLYVYTLTIDMISCYILTYMYISWNILSHLMHFLPLSSSSSSVSSSAPECFPPGLVPERAPTLNDSKPSLPILPLWLVLPFVSLSLSSSFGGKFIPPCGCCSIPVPSNWMGSLFPRSNSSP